MNAQAGGKRAVLTIKKYANRRLYNTETGDYLTLSDLAAMVAEGGEFLVVDARSGEDITHAILTNVIVEKESHGEPLLPVGFLRPMISLYGDMLQSLVPRYLEQVMQVFAMNQENLRLYLERASGGLMPFADPMQMGKRNEALLEWTWDMLTQFQPATAESPAPDRNRDSEIAALEAEVKAAERRLARLKAKKPGRG
ncbi:MAG: polyhydroxyalkanoate synthesis repressor PhaR [Hyphomicrobiales bacterium]|nr:polyhydroxyalkanoate synthesis repressor PhaR [Hyphomicrobiales bacterium]MCP5373320.1 polyhydroxyalkanoate synthesis repressor PhaR [Hyphomicrobiales bacterium]